MRLIIATAVYFAMAASGLSRQKRVDLSPDQLTFRPASRPNGIGILVIPGGGYETVSLDFEGANTTAYLNERGYDAWVLDYSVATTASTPLYPAPMDQALEAVAAIRDQDRGAALSKLGIWGYSAGGHLAAMTVTNPDAALDFGILAYPVITMDPAHAHMGSRDNLIGTDPSPDLQAATSAENTVTGSTPPIFLFHTSDDATVDVENTLLFSNAMAAKGRLFQTLILPSGQHGLGLALNDPVRNWTPELERWMKYSI
ncbi:Acetyl esterase/lipase [Geosmithia morbida]|uniref:Acetyl esterase/lipase n=1 Tax=Geosmithia morbida TaxID=1094350 RepID=A0A9P4YRN1_9HYPO|nr:Acetyl esterase/lipase [Geosmithia morbida]KAF4120577.1 Acetyl esterase/lipase [Geosmithia morbida]